MPSSLKSLHVLHSLGYGGITTFVQSLIDLNKDSNDIHEILVWKQVFSKPEEKKTFVIDISSSKSKQEDFEKIIQRYDHIFIHSLTFFMIKPLSLIKQKVFLFQHGLTLGSGKFKRIFKRSFYFYALNMEGFKTICSSRFAFQKLKNNLFWVSNANIIYIPFGIKLNDRKEVTPPKKILTIGSAGHLIPQKRFHKIFESMDFTSKQVDIKILIAGDGPEEENLKRISKKLASYNIECSFLGKVNNMNTFYDDLDVFVLPSKGESYGLVVLEALSRNIPVIVFSDSGACTNFISQGLNGFIVNEVKELGAKITQLGDPQKLNRLKITTSNFDISPYDIHETKRNLANL